ncbi:MAG TPA: NAD(P)/FAD-dependent oxidoreductase [Acidimicrobiia bacterium]
MSREDHDVVIIGGGPAGLNCALECFDIQLDTLVVEAKPELGGQAPLIPHSVRNVATGRFEDGPALQRALQETSAILGDRVHLSHPVTDADLDHRRIEAGGRTIAARALVIATGAERRELAAAVDGAFGGDVTYQLEHDPERFVGENVAVIGGGDSAALDALALAHSGSSSVALVHRSELAGRHDIVEDVRGEPRIEDLPGWELESVGGDDRLEWIVLVQPGTGERRTLPVRGVIVKIGRMPRTEVFRGQLELDRSGAIVVDPELRTSVDGVFAAGDVVSGAYARVAAALGHGSAAARSVLRYLEGRG